MNQCILPLKLPPGTPTVLKRGKVLKLSKRDGCHHLLEEEVHGSEKHDLVHPTIARCPHDGVFIGIDYTWANHKEGKRLHSISFTCNCRSTCGSPSGATQIGPIGTPTKENQTMHCPDNQHISYISGKSGAFVNEIQIHCVKSVQVVKNTKQEEREKNGVQSEVEPEEKLDDDYDFDDFDDSCMTSNGRRLYKVVVYGIAFVDTIMTAYKNIPVSGNCGANNPTES